MRRVHLDDHLTPKVINKGGKNVKGAHMDDHLVLKVINKVGDNVKGFTWMIIWL